jgi:hypothetical protein
LKDMGFELNPYDACVANKIINGTQCTIVWYFDDNKLAHINPHVVTYNIQKIEERFWKMIVTRGKQNIFLWMDLFLTTMPQCQSQERTMLRNALRITRQASSPAKKDLFETKEDLSTLPKEEAETFHIIVAKLLYVSIHGRPDNLLTVSFLCTRVSKSTIQDQHKLQRLLEYLNGTLDVTLTLGADTLSSIYTWVDASYTVHPDMKAILEETCPWGL